MLPYLLYRGQYHALSIYFYFTQSILKRLSIEMVDLGVLNGRVKIPFPIVTIELSRGKKRLSKKIDNNILIKNT